MDSNPYLPPTHSHRPDHLPTNNRIGVPVIVGAVTGTTLFLLSAFSVGTFFPLIYGSVLLGGSAALGGAVPARYLSPLWAAAVAALLTSNSYGDWIIYGIMAGVAAIPAMIVRLSMAQRTGQQ
jgi:hypothetical protein